MKIKQQIMKFPVKLGGEKKKLTNEAVVALEDTHFTENERSKNEQIACEGNDDFLQHQRHNHDSMGT
jgi:hypothetical protein